MCFWRPRIFAKSKKEKIVSKLAQLNSRFEFKPDPVQFEMNLYADRLLIEQDVTHVRADLYVSV